MTFILGNEVTNNGLKQLQAITMHIPGNLEKHLTGQSSKEKYPQKFMLNMHTSTQISPKLSEASNPELYRTADWTP
jgi:hypothetical protein